MARDTKQAEREYLQRAGSERWERTKPFIPAEEDYRDDAVRLMLDFAAAALFLELRPGHLVLDLGAGACWASEWLQRLGLRTVSVDIAADMLKVGGARLPRPSTRVAGDLEHLPLASASVDRAMCLNAFHHVPDQTRSLSEICRVLKPGGRVVFSEPGRGHAEQPHSVRAMEEFGVLEQDVLVAPFMRACLAAGFADVRIKPLAYAIPFFDLDADRWELWQQQVRRKRPVRALRKLSHNLAEAAGLGKGGPLLEEALQMEFMRVLRAAMEEHPIVVAVKG